MSNGISTNKLKKTMIETVVKLIVITGTLGVLFFLIINASLCDWDLKESL
jgi:hypothetical protein